MAKGLKDLQPDIVCIQESLRTDDFGLDTAAYLARALNLECSYGQGRSKKRIIEGTLFNCYSGLAILSKIAPLKVVHLSLQSSAEDNDRSFLSAVFYWKGIQLTVTNVHLTHVEHHDSLRRKQLLQSISTTQKLGQTSIQEKGDSLRAYSFLCGDLNWELTEKDKRELRSETDLLLEDCYIEGKGRLPGYTFGIDTDSPARLDYIFFLGAKEGETPIFKNGTTILTEKDADGLSGSDHLGVLVDVQL